MIKITTESFKKQAEQEFTNYNMQGTYPAYSIPSEVKTLYSDDVGGQTEDDIKKLFTKKKRKHKPFPKSF